MTIRPASRPLSDDIGSRGENLFCMLITKFCNAGRPFFRPHFLGEKFQTLDYLVELVATGPPMFFFAQVKSTRAGLTARGKNLKVTVSRTDFRRMVEYPAPTYVFGIDEPGERGYFGCVRHGKRRHIPSLPTTHEITAANLRRLRDEVRDFWSVKDMKQVSSAFDL